MSGHGNGNGKMTRNQASRQDNAVDRKKEERAVREGHRRQRKIESYLSDDENFPSFAVQLEKIGLQLRDIPGDGNCLFRALGDQLEGHGRNHFKHRFDVVKFMAEHRSDFEPFVEDDVPFDTHIQNLRKLGTYAGNDAIVAFARLQQVNVVIHQLSAPFILIHGAQGQSIKELHLSYHNGDHYSSIRKINDNTESPANIRLKHEANSEKKDHLNKVRNGMVRVTRDHASIEEEVMKATGCEDLAKIQQTLLDCDYDVDASIGYLLQLRELDGEGNSLDSLDDTTSLASQWPSTDSGVWSDGSTAPSSLRVNSSPSINNDSIRKKVHFREDSFGGSSGYGSLSSNNGAGARPKLMLPKHFSIQHLTPKQKREIKKIEKKKKAEERHRQKVLGAQTNCRPVSGSVSDDDSVMTVVSGGLSTMKI